MHDFLLSNLIVRPKSLVCDLDSLSKILILLKQQPKLLSIEKTLKFLKLDCHHHLGKSISQSYQGLMTWGFNDADEHPLCSNTL